MPLCFELLGQNCRLVIAGGGRQALQKAADAFFARRGARYTGPAAAALDDAALQNALQAQQASLRTGLTGLQTRVAALTADKAIRENRILTVD